MRVIARVGNLERPLLAHRETVPQAAFLFIGRRAPRCPTWRLTVPVAVQVPMHLKSEYPQDGVGSFAGGPSRDHHYAESLPILYVQPIYERLGGFSSHAKF